MKQHEAAQIILASNSAARKKMLQNCGIDFAAIPADIDEQALMQTMISQGRDVQYITRQLGVAKAKDVCAQNPAAIVIGSDQTLEFEGKILSKSSTKEEAVEKLHKLAGKTHRLYSSVCVVQNNNLLFTHTDFADLCMHEFDDNFISAYVEKEADALINCVGGYKIEAAGAWLFSGIKGDFFTIMGMPLLPLLAFLRMECNVSL